MTFRLTNENPAGQILCMGWPTGIHGNVRDYTIIIYMFEYLIDRWWFGNHYRIFVLQRPRICSVCLNHHPVYSSFIIYHRVYNKTITTSGIVEQEHLCSSPTISVVRVAQSLVFCVVFAYHLLFFSFYLAIV